MPKNAGLGGSLDQIDLDFVEGEATPRLLMKLSIQLHWLDCHFRILSQFLRYSVSNALDQLSIIGFTKQIYSPNMDRHRITLRLTKL